MDKNLKAMEGTHVCSCQFDSEAANTFSGKKHKVAKRSAHTAPKIFSPEMVFTRFFPVA
ncbi:MAG: hypothetical protein JSW39_26865 [Desulfobacterales bacterium]|nr:MAG: hypothetical protein JSW39_26865 [Desulfobacterales bacterium]